MKSLLLKTFSQDTSSLVLVDKELPKPAKGQVRVKMLYSAVNPSDFNFIRGDYHKALSRTLWNKGFDIPAFDANRTRPHPELPYIPGGEGIGIVEASGGGFLANRLIGKRVAFSAGPPNGTWQQYTLADAKKAIPVPDSIEDKQAAMLLINPLSCLLMLKQVLKVKSESWLIQSGAGSALGQMVIRLSKVYGFKTINLVRSDDKVDKLKSLGAEVVINTSKQSIFDAVFEATQGKGVNYAMDCIGGELQSDIMQCLTQNGHLVIYGTLAGPTSILHSRDLMMPCAKITGFFSGNWLEGMSLLQKLLIIRQLKKLAAQGYFQTDIAQLFELDGFKAALDAASTIGQPGKVLFRFT